MKKIFIASISMLPIEKLTPIYYSFEGKDTDKTCFPSIPMLERNIAAEDDVKIVAVMTEDDNGRTEQNYKVFLNELKALSARIGKELTVDETVVVPHNEERSKLIGLLKSLCAVFESDAKVYMDVTYGSKVTSIELFSSLVFGAKVKNCDIRSIIYGKYNHAENNEKGNIFDIRCLYDIINLIYAADYLPENKIEALLDQLWG